MADNKAKVKGMTKSAVMQDIATTTKLTKKQVNDVFEALAALVKKELGKKGPGAFTIPGLLKLTKKIKPATKARKGVPNPFKPGTTMDVDAKPARAVVRARALKTLSDTIK
jgi:nucleoid DNA-binding protein